MLPAPPHLVRDHALFLDFDGTLARLRDNPDEVRLSEGESAMLSRLAEALSGAVAVVTGRDIRDISARVPDGLWRAGNHGLAIAAPGEAAGALPDAAPAMRAAAQSLADRHEGVWLEVKGPVLALHSRGARASVADLADALAGFDPSAEAYRLERGKDIVELKPDGARKGAAVERLMDRLPFEGRVPVFLGDDTTDEDGFAAVDRLGGISVRVGGGETCAHYALEDTDSVWNWLERGLDGFT